MQLCIVIQNLINHKKLSLCKTSLAIDGFCSSLPLTPGGAIAFNELHSLQLHHHKAINSLQLSKENCNGVKLKRWCFTKR